MTRRDTIILAVLCNLVILACVLATARQLTSSDTRHGPSSQSSQEAVPEQELAAEGEPLIFDEIDQLLEEYVAEEPPQQEPATGAKNAAPQAATKKTKPSGDQYYTVKPGDNPWKIAKKFHISFEKLLKLNHLDEAKARNLKVGQQLKIRDS